MRLFTTRCSPCSHAAGAMRGRENSFKMVNWSSEGFIEGLSFVACFPNPLTHRHTPGIGSGYSRAPRLAGQDPVLHRPLIPRMATYLTEGVDLTHSQTSYLRKCSRYLLRSPAPFFLSFLPLPRWPEVMI